MQRQAQALGDVAHAAAVDEELAGHGALHAPQARIGRRRDHEGPAAQAQAEPLEPAPDALRRGPAQRRDLAAGLPVPVVGFEQGGVVEGQFLGPAQDGVGVAGDVGAVGGAGAAGCGLRPRTCGG